MYLISSLFVAAVAVTTLASCGGNDSANDNRDAAPAPTITETVIPEETKEEETIPETTITEDTITESIISGDTPTTNKADQNDDPKEVSEEIIVETPVTETEEPTEEEVTAALEAALEERTAAYIINRNAFYESVKNNAYTRAYYESSENSTGTKVSEIERFKLAIIKYAYTYNLDGETYTYTNWKLTIAPDTANKNIESDVFYVSNFEYLTNADYTEEYIKLTIRAYVFRDNSNNIYDIIAVNDGLAEGKPSSLNYKLEEKTFRIPAGLYTFTQD
jgi:ABC-type uncharacterized transport system auxiliary subunit